MQQAPFPPVTDPGNPGKSRRRKRLSILIACVLIASALWFLRAFENEYTTRVDHPVRYINMPDKMITVNSLPQRISLEVKGLGFSVLKHNWNFSKTPLIIDIKKLRAIPNRNLKGFVEYLPMNQFLNDFSAQLKDLKVQSINPDTLMFRFAVKKTRKFKVIPNFVYDAGATILPDSLVRINPDSVLLDGPDLILDTLFTIKTLPIKVNRSGSSFIKNIGLSEIHKMVKTTPAKVSVSVKKKP